VVRYFGFPGAFVVAETFEQARDAAALVRLRYTSLPAEYDLRAAAPHAENPGETSTGDPADSAIGDFESAFAAAPVKIDAYITPYQHSAPMETHASMAFWEGEMLTVCMAAQLTTSPREGLARTLDIPPENVRIITRYIGGGFGNKLPYYADATLAAISARMLRRPVKVAMTRPQLFHTTTHRTASEQRVRLGADRDGRLAAYGQDAVVQCARFDNYTEPVCLAVRSLYAAANRLTRHRLAKLDLPRSDSMRAPGDAIGLLALECAMDELAEALALDPVELRLRNDTQIEPESKLPFSSRHLAECLREGASRFGWDRRVAKPTSVRDGRWLVGLGVASAIRGDVLKDASARARLEKRWPLDCRAGHDRHRDRQLHDPHSDRRRCDGVAGRPRHGSSRRHEFSADRGIGRVLRGGHLRFGRACGLPQAQGSARVRDHGSGGIGYVGRSRQSLWTCRVRRAFRRGRSGSGHGRGPRPAHARRVRGRPHSQCQDRALADDRRNDLGHRRCADGGKSRRSALRLFVNQDLASYHVVVNADVGAIDAVFLDESDPHGNPLGSKGIGELGICGAGAAVINAIYNATGARIHDFPATPDKLLPALEALDG
jgi:xanthine dehydrogenase YagR molybdenum-binding subunit